MKDPKATAREGMCPFDHAGLSAASLPAVSAHASPTELTAQARLASLRSFIGDTKFICEIGAVRERAGAIDYTLLTAPDVDGNYLSKLASGVKLFHDKGVKAAWVIMLPHEPKDYLQLQKIKNEICGNLIVAISMLGEDVQSLCNSASQRKPQVNRLQLKKDARVVAVSSETLRGGLEIYLRAEMSEPNFDLAKSISKFSREFYEAMPNATPTFANEKRVQMVVMSPLFQQNQVSSCPVLDQHQIPHGRYAPSSCVVLTYVEEVNRMKNSLAGATTKRNLARSTIIYNQHAPEDGRYDPSDVLTPPYLRQEGKEIDEFMMSHIEEIVDKSLQRDEEEKSKHTHIAPQDSAVEMQSSNLEQMLSKLTGGSKDPNVVLAALRSLQ